MRKESQKTRFFPLLTVIFSAFSARALSGNLVYRFIWAVLTFLFSADSLFQVCFLGSRGWHRGESARLLPMWPGFKSRRRRHMWVEFVVGSLLCSERFFSGYSGFPLSSKTNISKFQFDQESGRRGTTLWMCYLQIITYLFMFTVPLMRMTDLLNRLFNF